MSSLDVTTAPVTNSDEFAFHRSSDAASAKTPAVKGGKSTTKAVLPDNVDPAAQKDVPKRFVYSSTVGAIALFNIQVCPFQERDISPRT